MVIIFLRTKDISFNNNYKSLCESRNVSWGPTDNLISPEGGGRGGVPRPNISTILNTGGLLSFPLLQKPRSVMSYQIPNKKR